MHCPHVTVVDDYNRLMIIGTSLHRRDDSRQHGRLKAVSCHPNAAAVTCQALARHVRSHRALRPLSLHLRSRVRQVPVLSHCILFCLRTRALVFTSSLTSHVHSNASYISQQSSCDAMPQVLQILLMKRHDRSHSSLSPLQLLSLRQS